MTKPDSKRITGCMLTSSIAEECTRHPGSSNPKGPRVELLFRSPQWFTGLLVCSAAMLIGPFGQRLRVGSPKSALHFGLGNWVVFKAQRNRGRRWITGDI